MQRLSGLRSGSATGGRYVYRHSGDGRPCSGQSGHGAGLACAPELAGRFPWVAGYQNHAVTRYMSMCELYVKADPILYESRSRSLRICGVVTTLRLENQFWDILSEIAEVDGMTTNQLIAKLYEEVMDYRGEVVNFASFLRVSCTRYLSQRRTQAPELSVVRTVMK